MGNVSIRSMGIGLVAVMALTLMVAGPAWAVNSLVIDTKTVPAGTSNVQIGIFLTNDTIVRNLVIPLTLRSISGGAFISKMAVKRTAGARLTGRLTGINIINGYYMDPDSIEGCHTPPPYLKPRPGFGKVGWGDTLSHADSVSIPPVAVLYSLGALFPGDAKLLPGTDGAIPSLHLLVDIGNSGGRFEIDSVCTTPFNHLVYAIDSASKFPKRIPEFTKGVITVPCTMKSFSAVPSGPIPANGAQDQLDPVTLKWNPVTDSCGIPVTYDVLFGPSNCLTLGTVGDCTGIDADSCPLTKEVWLPNTTYFWKVIITDWTGRKSEGPCWTFKTGSVGVQYLGGDGIPRDYSLDQNYPNPFNPSTVIRFNIKHDGHVRLDVFNILGQKVKTLVDEFRHLGPQAADWDGTDLAGRTVPTGLYFYRLVTSDYTDVKKMMLLK